MDCEQRNFGMSIKDFFYFVVCVNHERDLFVFLFFERRRTCSLSIYIILDQAYGMVFHGHLSDLGTFQVIYIYIYITSKL